MAIGGYEQSAAAPSHAAVDESFEFKYSGKELGEDRELSFIQPSFPPPL